MKSGPHSSVIILGYSGFDASVAYARQEAACRPGEERIVQGLDSAAALLVGGRIVAAAAEERFSFEKHTNAFPASAISYCLEEAGITSDQIDAVAHGFNYERFAEFFRHSDQRYYETVVSPTRQLELWRARFGRALGPEEFVPVDHHLAHAASAYFPSGFDEALCIVADGMGEVTSLTVYSAKSGEFTVLDSFPIQSSVGILYGLVTVHLGFKFNADEYKVMGLAPYGDPARYRAFFERITDLSADGRYSIRFDRIVRGQDPRYRIFLQYLQEKVLSRPEGEDALTKAHCDFAAAAQECLEKILFHVVGHWRRRTGVPRLCMAGGVALNCTFNGKLLERQLFDETYVQPAAGDDGSGLGAAFVVARQKGEELAAANVREPPLYGPSFSPRAVRSALENFADRIEIENLASDAAAAEDAAAALDAGDVIAWFQGRMEFGPRALGNRSILGNPLIADIKERLNSIVKLREGFRPFAPAVTEERANDYFLLQPSSLFEYMLATCSVRHQWRGRLRGITHVDGSARVQTVSRRKSPLFHQLITCFGERTGVHCVVNTSFNVRGQPMIVSPEVAAATFLKIGIQRLYVGTLRISKREIRYA